MLRLVVQDAAPSCINQWLQGPASYTYCCNISWYRLRPTILVHHPPHFQQFPTNQPTLCHQLPISVPLHSTSSWDPMVPTSGRSLHWAPDAAKTIFNLTRGLFFGKTYSWGGTICKIQLNLPWFCHFEWLLLSICVCSIVMLQDKCSYYYKNDDSGQSRATFILFLAHLGAEICRNSRLQFAC